MPAPQALVHPRVVVGTEHVPQAPSLHVCEPAPHTLVQARVEMGTAHGCQYP
jgi:hypothetical protein